MTDPAVVVLLVAIAVHTLLLLVGLGLMVRDTVRRRGRFGVNLRPVRCPECGEPAPAVRVPKTLRQTLWGGCTCGRCGAEYDKWGEPVPEMR